LCCIKDENYNEIPRNSENEEMPKSENEIVKIVFDKYYIPVLFNKYVKVYIHNFKSSKLDIL